MTNIFSLVARFAVYSALCMPFFSIALPLRADTNSEVTNISGGKNDTTRGLPVVEFFVASQDTLKVLSPVVLSWKVRDAVRVDIADGNLNTVYPNLGNANSIQVYPDRTARYILYAYNSEGNVTSSIVTVQVALSPAYIESFEATTTLSEPRQPVRLWWRVRNVNTVDIQDISLGVTYRDLPAEGGYIDVYPEKTSTYILTAAVPGTPQVSQPLIIRVKEYKLTIDYFNASTLSAPVGTEIVLRWQVTNSIRTELFEPSTGQTIPVPNLAEYRFIAQRTGIYYLYAYGDLGQLATAQLSITVTPKPPVPAG